LRQLPVIGPGGPNNAPDPEKILAVGPDVIFSTYAADTAAADELQEKTGIPVVALSYGKTSEFDPAVYDSLGLVGKITGQNDKAQAAVTFMRQCQQDLDDRTKAIADESKPRVYVGALSMKGTHGIESTQGEYALLDVLHALNVADETGKTGSVMIDKEKLLDWNPDIIFIDAAVILSCWRITRTTGISTIPWTLSRKATCIPNCRIKTIPPILIRPLQMLIIWER
jgi:iron complex transport system substrate-binding protein